MNLRTTLFGVAAVLVVAGLVVLAVVMWPSHDSAVVDESSPATVAAAPNDNAADAAAALARLESEPLALVPEQDLDELGGRMREAVPEGSMVHADPSTWAPDGLGGGVMQVQITPPGQAPRNYLAVMAQEDGEWKVLSTMPIG